ncbi:PREDICTED: poly(A)-specific ribonuclease PARN-like [Dinoponera quadriceps]|uniref:Poly(A)-specific ribonuclease PARN-like n=1 Tax=Dinoponera quadriceps TaxID=609295 RepID=A0A6P3XH90_DINQU|nr:PREDICTED: poly(A)-specific ribonuclease PARN-like [Dinoponera quadriceps]XP_014477830.1 PREDICTED: poly(A)-specific ribonuclease PARN-like [Dinoponera quadriceps]
MEVTILNFRDVLSELDNDLKRATFICIDTEFTGLNSGPETGPFDTPAEYYTKLRMGSMNFLLVQFGLSLFTYNSETKKYSQRSYTFYVFPKPMNCQAPDCRFMCQASSMVFLANQNFDFNKLFKYGIPYLNINEEKKLIKLMEEKQKQREAMRSYHDAVTSITSDNDKLQIEEICSKIKDFLASDKEELTIERCNSFIRRLVHQEAKTRWPDKVRVESKIEDTFYRNCLLVQKVGTKEQEEEKENQRREKEKLEFEQAVGISNLLKKIISSGKPIVGHNMLLDLCHIIHQFVTPLPVDYLEFKDLVHNLFPRLLDTKVICQSQPFKDHVSSSNLNMLLEIVSKPPFSIPDVESVEGRSYSITTEKLHEAGYDAYITGLCFIALSNYLGTITEPENAVTLPDFSSLNPFLNKLPIGRLKDVPYVNLVGKDPNPSRDHVFHITFPKEWKKTDINKLFSPYGGVHISWLTDTTAYVALFRRENVGAVMSALSKETVCTIKKYLDHKASLNASGVCSEDRKRKLSVGNADKPGNGAISILSSLPTSAAHCSLSTSTEISDEGWEVATGKRRKKRKEQNVTNAEVINKRAFTENDVWD